MRGSSSRLRVGDPGLCAWRFLSFHFTAAHTLSLESLLTSVLKNGPKVKLYTGIMYVREILRNFILSQRPERPTIYTVE